MGLKQAAALLLVLLLVLVMSVIMGVWVTGMLQEPLLRLGKTAAYPHSSVPV